MKKQRAAKSRPERAKTPNNLVAKHANTYNQSQVFKDRKQAQKKGYMKHKKKDYLKMIFSALSIILK